MTSEGCRNYIEDSDSHQQEGYLTDGYAPYTGYKPPTKLMRPLPMVWGRNIVIHNDCKLYDVDIIIGIHVYSKHTDYYILRHFCIFHINAPPRNHSHPGILIYHLHRLYSEPISVSTCCTCHIHPQNTSQLVKADVSWLD